MDFIKRNFVFSVVLIASMQIHDVSYGIELTRDGVSICSDDTFESDIEAVGRSYKPLHLFLTDLEDDLESLGEDIKVIKLTSCSIDSEILKTIFSRVLSLEKVKHRLEILDLSHNEIDEACLEEISAILNFPRLLYFNITGNPISLKNIKKVVEPLVASGVELPVIGKLIFMEKTYIWHAKNRVKVYNELKESGKLPKDWAKRHVSYYKLQGDVSDISLSFESMTI